MADINVVPYIDVMLVLLVIFMVTAPLITQGIKVDLPQADAEPVPAESTLPAVITVDEFGDYYLTLDDGDAVPVDGHALTQRLRNAFPLGIESHEHGIRSTPHRRRQPVPKMVHPTLLADNPCTSNCRVTAVCRFQPHSRKTYRPNLRS